MNPPKCISSEYVFSRIMLLVAVIEPIFAIPQIYRIYSRKEADDFSLISQTFYFFTSILWVIHAFKKKDRTLMISCFLWMVSQFVTIVGIVLYY